MFLRSVVMYPAMRYDPMGNGSVKQCPFRAVWETVRPSVVEKGAAYDADTGSVSLGSDSFLFPIRLKKAVFFYTILNGFVKEENMKKTLRKCIAPLMAAVLALSMLFAVTAMAEETPAAPADGEGIELVVFAAASMTETLQEIAELYKEVAPEVTLTFNFDSSGTLKTQIEEGAECDIFISAAPKQMNALDAAKDADGGNTDGLDFVLSDTRIDLLENKVVLAVPEGNPANINSYDDMAAGLKEGTILLAMGNADVPVGQYTQKIFAYYELNEEELAAAQVLSYGSNVKEVTTQVSAGSVDCGIIYATDAYSAIKEAEENGEAPMEVVDTATKEMCGQVIYPAAVLNITENEEAAKAFLEYLTGPEASEVFETVGFTPIAGAEDQAGA